MSFHMAVIGFAAVFLAMDLICEYIERRIQRRRSIWRFGHPAFFQDLKRTHFPEDLR